MANSLYDKVRSVAATTGVGWTTATIKAALIDTGIYTFNIGHSFLSDVNVSARVSTATLTGKSVLSNGACDAGDTTFTAVTGSTVEAFILYVDTGVESTSVLILYCDSMVGLPFTPLGMDVKLVWDNGVNAIFKL